MHDDVTIVVQARTNSTRFPGKVMMDFLGFPIAVLAAKRAGSRGHRVLLATSEENSDDALAEVAARHGITCVRGPLDDVLQRYVIALAGCSDDEICVRLTADNIVPDGDLISDVVSDFKSRGLDYLHTTDPTSGLPYGCSVEVTRVGLIRQAAINATSDFEREHVSHWILKNRSVAIFTKFDEIGRSHYRCTIDCLDDYFSLIRFFPRNREPAAVGWREVIDSISSADGQPMTANRINKFVLGTAQFGMPYGIVHANEPDETESVELIKQAIQAGVDWIDTARAYGRSEEVIGKLMSTGWAGRSRVVTKLSPMAECEGFTDSRLAAAIAENSLLSSCIALQCTNLDTVLLHRAAHLKLWDGKILDVLQRWRSEKRLNIIGVSVQSQEELLLVLDFAEIEHVQLPFNILDHRWAGTVDRIRAARAERKLVIHARSPFLQGLLLSDSPRAWASAHVSDPNKVRAWLWTYAKASGYTNIAAFCLAFVRSQDWIDGVVVGIDNRIQLQQVISSFDQPLLSARQLDQFEKHRPMLTRKSLDPAQWTLTKGGCGE